MIEYWEGAEHNPRDWQFDALPLLIDALRKGERPIVSATMGAGKSILIAEVCWVALHKLKAGCCIIIATPRQHLVDQLAATVSKRVGEDKVGKFYAYQKDMKPIIVCCYASARSLILSITENDLSCSMLIGDEVHGTESEAFKAAYEEIDPACAVGFTATPFRSSDRESLTLWDTVAYRYTAEEALRDGVIVPWKLIHWGGEKFKPTQINEICIDLIRKHGKGPGIVNALDIEDAAHFAKVLQAEGFRAECIHSGLGKVEQQIRIARLREGYYDILVHVNMLSEGVDFPFLRWLCMRRPVQARVRFVQEVGRVLRADVGKKEAIIMDPFDLFSQHGLIYPEALGELLIEKEKDPDEEMLAKLDIEDEDAVEEFKSMRPAVAVSKVESYIRGVIVAFRANGLAQPPNPEFELSRSGTPTMRQLTTLQRVKWATRYLPESHREDIKRLFEPERAANLSRGSVSDLLDMCFALAAKSKAKRAEHRHWPFPSHILLPKPSIPIQGLLFISEK